MKISAAAPMDLVAVDVLSGLPQAHDGSTCIIVAVDYMTKWADAYALPNEEASTCMDALYAGMFSRFGMPNQLHSDQDEIGFLSPRQPSVCILTLLILL